MLAGNSKLLLKRQSNFVIHFQGHQYLYLRVSVVNVHLHQFVCLKKNALPVTPPNPERLFPPHDDRKVIHIIEQGASIRKKAEQLILYVTCGIPPQQQSCSFIVHQPILMFYLKNNYFAGDYNG